MNAATSTLDTPNDSSPLPLVVSVSAEMTLPQAASVIWSRLAGPGRLPGEVLEVAHGHRILFRLDGTAGWLPIEPPVAGYEVEEVPGGTRVTVEAKASVRPEQADLVRRRLQGWADGSVAAFRAHGYRRAA